MYNTVGPDLGGRGFIARPSPLPPLLRMRARPAWDRPRYSWRFVDAWDYQPIAQRDYYWPGSVDVIPHLLPDIHPWCLGLGVPANPVWQTGGCHGFPQNPLLYFAPCAVMNNPPWGAVGDDSFDPG